MGCWPKKCGKKIIAFRWYCNTSGTYISPRYKTMHVALSAHQQAMTAGHTLPNLWAGVSMGRLDDPRLVTQWPKPKTVELWDKVFLEDYYHLEDSDWE